MCANTLVCVSLITSSKLQGTVVGCIQRTIAALATAEREEGERVLARWVLFVYISGHLYAYTRTETARQHYLP